MAFDINVIIDFSPDVKQAIATALAGGPQRYTGGEVDAVMATPGGNDTVSGNGAEPVKRRGRPPRTPPNVTATPEDRREPEPAVTNGGNPAALILEEPQPNEINPLDAIGVATDSPTLKKLMLLLAAQTDRDKAVGLMTEYAATAPEAFGFSSVSNVPAPMVPYMVNSILDHVDLDAKKSQGRRFLKGEIDASEVMIP